MQAASDKPGCMAHSGFPHGAAAQDGGQGCGVGGRGGFGGEERERAGHGELMVLGQDCRVLR